MLHRIPTWYSKIFLNLQILLREYNFNKDTVKLYVLFLTNTDIPPEGHIEFIRLGKS
jgi:hypothetical protein